MKKHFLFMFLLTQSTCYADSSEKLDVASVGQSALSNAYHLSSSVEMSLNGVSDAENQGELIVALSRAKAIYDNHPTHPLAALAYGRVLVKNGNSKQAIKTLQPLATETTQDWQPWFWLGSAQLIDGDLVNAANSLDEALAREGQVVALWIQRAIVEQELGNPESAMHMLQVANGIEPNNTDVMVNYAYASEHAGDLAKATMIYKRFLQLSASKPSYGSLRSQILSRLSKIESARKTTTSKAKPVSQEQELSSEELEEDSDEDFS